MSLILEALRKSEAERRLGSAPDLLATMPAALAPPSRRRWPLLVVAVVLLAMATAMGWWWSREPVSAAQVAIPPPVPESATGAILPATNAAPADRTESASRGAAQQPVAPAVTPMPAIAPIPVHPGAAVAPLRGGPGKIGPAAAPKPAAVVVAAAVGSPPTASSENKASVTASAGVASTAPAQAPAPVAPADEPALPPVSELSSAERSGLPALKVTMHVYAENPAQRFMIVDGQRVGEGDRLGGGIVLVRIRRDGAEIDVNGRRMLLPNP